MSEHHHTHDHTHQHHHNSASLRSLTSVSILTGLFMIVEGVGGFWTGSLALLADAGHMLTDVGALLLTLSALIFSNRPADASRSYGYQRLQTLAAFTNGIVLLLLSLWIIFEAIGRLFSPITIEPIAMSWIAAAGFAVNLISFWILHSSKDHSVNMKGALLHILSDLLGSVAALSAGLIIFWKGWNIVDPIFSILATGLIIRNAWHLVHHSGHILLEGTPEHLDAGHIASEITTHFKEVLDVHHIHIWSLSGESALLTLHATLHQNANHKECLKKIQDLLKTHFHIHHTNIQLEYEGYDCLHEKQCH